MQPRELVHSWVEAFNRADPEALAGFYTEDAVNHQVAETPVHDEWGSYLNNIHVAQAAQGVGVGASLLHATAELCALAYVREDLYLWVLQSNTKAQGVYARYGARNTGTDIWHAPDGTVAPLFRFSWESVVALQNVTANPSIERTATGKPVPAAHVKR